MNAKLCEAANCELLATGIIVADTDENYCYCDAHMAEHEAICKRIQADLDAGVDEAIAVRREQVRREADRG